MTKDRQEALFDAILQLKTRKECEQFLYDLCTPAEIEEFSSRWLAARLLMEKKPYRTISEETGISTTTVGRVARFLKYGNNGYLTVLKRMGYINE
jgi:TrpR-related protein YerC/YecD